MVHQGWSLSTGTEAAHRRAGQEGHILPPHMKIFILERSLYSFPRPAVAKYHKWGDFRQQKCILS